jgi:uncharacterized membrane protein
VGIALAGVGVASALPAATVAVVGTRDAVRSWNDQIGILPWDLARLAGARDGSFPVEIVTATTVVGVIVAVVGIVLALPTRGSRRAR